VGEIGNGAHHKILYFRDFANLPHRLSEPSTNVGFCTKPERSPALFPQLFHSATKKKQPKESISLTMVFADKRPLASAWGWGLFVVLIARFGSVAHSFVPSPTTSKFISLLLPPTRIRGVALQASPIVYDISSPDDLKNFVTYDDRPAIIKVYANFCKTCKQFDLRYRKVASAWGESFEMSEVDASGYSNRARFAQMDYGGE
jgi:thiol-disulfide isomerase/thioredoxin